MKRLQHIISIAASWPVVSGALLLAAVIGSVLNLIHQWPAIVSGTQDFSPTHGVLNYIVPYFVASFSATRFALGQEVRANASSQHKRAKRYHYHTPTGLIQPIE